MTRTLSFHLCSQRNKRDERKRATETERDMTTANDQKKITRGKESEFSVVLFFFTRLAVALLDSCQLHISIVFHCADDKLRTYIYIFEDPGFAFLLLIIILSPPTTTTRRTITQIQSLS